MEQCSRQENNIIEPSVGENQFSTACTGMVEWRWLKWPSNYANSLPSPIYTPSPVIISSWSESTESKSLAEREQGVWSGSGRRRTKEDEGRQRKPVWHLHDAEWFWSVIAITAEEDSDGDALINFSNYNILRDTDKDKGSHSFCGSQHSSYARASPSTDAARHRRRLKWISQC